MRDLIFALVLGTGEAEKDALRLAHSIRTFGGELCFNPIWMLSQKTEDELAETTRHALFSLGARLVTFDVEEGAGSVPFGEYVTAAAIAEGLAQGDAACLAVMASDSLVLQAPVELVLPAGKSLGACPVHLKLLGAGYDEPVDDFWSRIYSHCRVDVNRIFPLRTIVDEQVVRAYVNAGLLAVHPERGLLRAWKANFDRLAGLPEFAEFYAQNELYAIFMHQAVLAGTILGLLQSDEFQQLPFEMNYPLHLHLRMQFERRAVRLDELITCRYEDFEQVFGPPGVERMIYVDNALKDWLDGFIR